MQIAYRPRGGGSTSQRVEATDVAHASGEIELMSHGAVMPALEGGRVAPAADSLRKRGVEPLEPEALAGGAGAGTGVDSTSAVPVEAGAGSAGGS